MTKNISLHHVRVGQVYLFKPKKCLVFRCYCCSNDYEDIADYEEHLMLNDMELLEEAELELDILEEEHEPLHKRDEHEPHGLKQINVAKNEEHDSNMVKSPSPQYFLTLEQEQDFKEYEEYAFDEGNNSEIPEEELFEKVSQLSNDLYIELGTTDVASKPKSSQLISSRASTDKKSPDQKSFSSVRCDQCDFVTNNSTNLRLHHNRKHSYQPRIHKCGKCELAFKTKANRDAHEKRHDKPSIICSNCGKAFHTPGELKFHERFHTGEKPYACDTCGRRFHTSSHLLDHKRRESNERHFACELCDKRFKVKSLLKKHYIVHSNERNIVCDICEARFSRKKAYKLHLKLHINAKEYKCEFCPMEFNQKAALSSHLRIRHQHTNNANQINATNLAMQHAKLLEESLHSLEQT